MVHTVGMDLETREWLQGRIDGRVAAGIGIAWLVAYQLAAALEPVTHKPEPWYGIVLNLAFMGLLAATVTGLVMQRRWGLVVSLAAAGFFTALSVACPVSGHHPFGLWWFGQMACALGMVGASLVALNWSTRVDAPVDPPVDSPADAESAQLSAGDAASRG
jgi:hypothetical protein